MHRFGKLVKKRCEFPREEIGVLRFDNTMFYANIGLILQRYEKIFRQTGELPGLGIGNNENVFGFKHGRFEYEFVKNRAIAIRRIIIFI